MLSRTGRRWVTALAVVMCLAFAAAVAGIGAGWSAWSAAREEAARSPHRLLESGADDLASAPALRLVMSTLGTDGRVINADVTITADQYVSGVVTDPGGGRAEIVSGAGRSAVRGDKTWWARREPGQVSALADRWVRPRPGVAFPLDMATQLNPTQLGRLVTAMAEAVARHTDTPAATGSLGRLDASPDAPDEAERVDGHPVRLISVGDWSALVTTDRPAQVKWLTGPIDDGAPVWPATDTGRATQLDLPLWRGADVPDGGVQSADDPPVRPARWTATPIPAGQDAGPVHTAVARVLPQPAAAPSDAASAAPSAAPSAATSEPPEQSGLTTALPHFEAVVNGSDCNTPMCSWSVTVTNTGAAPGQAVVSAKASPGMSTAAVFDLGVLQPGEERTTPTITYPNQAPRVPGQTTKVIVDHEAWITSATLGSPSTTITNRLQQRGLSPDTILPTIDPAYRSTALTALDAMTRHAPASDTATTEKAQRAIEAATRVGLLPELKAIIDSGRLANPSALVGPLSEAAVDSTLVETDKDGGLGYRREIEQVAEILRRDPTARLIYDAGITINGKTYRADILDTHNHRAYQIKTDTRKGVVGKTIAATKQLLGKGNPSGATQTSEEAPPGYRKIAVIYIEPSSTQYYWDRAGITRRLYSQHLGQTLCDPNRIPLIDEIHISNGTGVHSWINDGGTNGLAYFCQ